MSVQCAYPGAEIGKAVKVTSKDSVHCRLVSYRTPVALVNCFFTKIFFGTICDMYQLFLEFPDSGKMGNFTMIHQMTLLTSPFSILLLSRDHNHRWPREPSLVSPVSKTEPLKLSDLARTHPNRQLSQKPSIFWEIAFLPFWNRLELRPPPSVCYCCHCW